jgi:hypothetical protein
MTMSKTWKWILTAAPLLALMLAMPAVARAQCTLVAKDIDGNGRKDMQIDGAPGTTGTVIINAEPAQATVTVVCGGIANKVYIGDFSVFFVYLRGNARVTFNVTGNWVDSHKKIAIQSGYSGVSVVVGGTGTMTNSSLLVEVAGMAAADSFTVAPPLMDNSRYEVHADLADGNDTAIINLKNPITNGSVVGINVTTGDGNLSSGVNTGRITQTALIDATVSVDFDGTNNGNLTDYGYLTLAGPIGPGGRLTVRSDLGDGPNSFRGSVSLPLFSVAAGGEVHVDVWGRSGSDDLSVSRTGTLGGAGSVMAGLLDINLDGGAGADLISVDLAGGGFKLDGTLRIRENGGPGADNLTALVDVDASSTTPNLDVYLYGGAGGDRLNATIHDNGPRTPANYGLGEAAFLDGGVDAGDICTVGAGNTGLVHKRNCEG